MSLREQFEAAVIKRMKESGFLEVEIRVECLGRAGDGYADASVDAYWHFWQESRTALVVELPKLTPAHMHSSADVWTEEEVRDALEAAGLKVAP